MNVDNVYNTTDPQKLLELKRLEADALLDVLRTINLEGMSIRNLCVIARNTLIAQLGVKKMVFLFLAEGIWNEGMRLGFSEFSDEALEEMMEITETTKLDRGGSERLYDLGVEYVIPITYRGSAVAYFSIADFADSEVEAQNDVIFIETLGNILAVAIRNRELFREKMEQEFLQKELDVAEKIQSQLLISDFDRFSELDIYGMNRAHHGIGGDFYDIIKKEQGDIFVCIADVSGKGIGAALLMANLQANLRALTAQYQDPEVIIQELNNHLYGIAEGDKFVTLFLAKIDASQKRISYVNAGHNYPIFLSEKGPERLMVGCMLLGIVPSLEVSSKVLSYEEGDLLFMFTDGVVEQTNKADEMFGSERIVDELKKIKKLSSFQIIQHLQERLMTFSGGVDAIDDVTMLSVKFSSRLSSETV